MVCNVKEVLRNALSDFKYRPHTLTKQQRNAYPPVRYQEQGEQEQVIEQQKSEDKQQVPHNLNSDSL
jgi:hypothetical protein